MKDAAPAPMPELIALAVALTVRYDDCNTAHAKATVEHGAARDEMVEALGVAVAVNAGAPPIYSTRVLDATAAVAEGTPAPS